MALISKLINSGKIGVMDVVGIGSTVYFGAQSYKDSRAQGNNKLVAGMSAVGEFVKGEMLGLPGMLALGAINGAPQLAASAYTGISKLSRQASRNRYGANIPFYNSTFMDTQQAYTMRQAGMQLAENSKYNLQQSLMGNEASMLHI